MIVVRIVLGILLAVVATLTVVRVLGLDRAYPLVPAMTVFPYFVGLGVLVAVIAVPLRLWPEASVGGVVAVVGIALLVPRVLPGPVPDPAPTGPELTVAVANLLEGRGDAETLVRMVDDEDVDLLVVLELTDASIDALERAGLDDRLPEAVKIPSRFTSGGGIWSRYPLTEREPSRMRGFGSTPRATIDIPGHGPLEVDAVHPLPPITPDWTAGWARVLDALPEPATEDGAPRRLLAGDANATLDHRRFRALLGKGWVDAADAQGAGLRPTFSGLGTGEPVPPVTLDHVLVDREVAVEAVVTRPLPRSDHRMLVAHLWLPAG